MCPLRPAPQNRNDQNGNVLILILVAIALFAALSYVVTKSSRTGGGDITEKTSLIAADVVQYGNQIELAIERIRLTRGTSDWGLDMYSPRLPAEANATCPNQKCQVFSTLGGGVAWRQPQYEDGITNPGSQAFYSAAVRNIGTDAPELVMSLGNLSEEACQVINFKTGVTPSLTTLPPADTMTGGTAYTGTLTEFPASSKVFGDAPNTLFAGKRSFCYSDTASGHVYIHILIPR